MNRQTDRMKLTNVASSALRQIIIKMVRQDVQNLHFFCNSNDQFYCRKDSPPNSLNWKHILRRMRSSTNLYRRPSTLVAPIKAVKTVAIILGSFYICWLPLLIYLLAFPNYYDNFVIQCLAALALLNSAMNPIVYGLRHKIVRLAIKDMLKCKWIKRNSVRDANFVQANTNDVQFYLSPNSQA